MANKIAFIFPGQGAQYAGMGKSLATAYADAAEVFVQADRCLDIAISEVCFQGTEDDLKLTENTQPAVLTVSTAAQKVLEAKGVVPDYVAGHSLGEYSALVAAQSLRFDAAVMAVRRRGRYMQEAVPVGEGAMAAILGLDVAEVESVCQRVSQGRVVAPANFNSPSQTVIAGDRDAVERALPEAKKAGAKRAVLLPVSAPFHSSLMGPAEELLGPDLDNIDFSDLKMPLVTNVDATTVETGKAARDALKRQPSRPVRWTETVRLLLDAGVDTFIEVGPGKVLSGLVRSVEKSVTMLHVEDEPSLEKTLAALK